MTIKPYQEPRERLPYAVRMRNRCIAAALFLILCFGIGSCIFKKDQNEVLENGNNPKIEVMENVGNEPGVEQKSGQVFMPHEKIEPTPTSPTNVESLVRFEQASGEQVNVEQESVEPPRAEATPIDSAYLKNQKDVFMAEKIDNLLRRFKPENAIILLVDAQSNEILAWGERKDNEIQTKPDYLVRNTFPAASLAKTITVAAALESNRYSLDTPIPLIGRAHHLYKNQLRVPKNYHGPTATVQDSYAHSYNPTLGIMGLDLGAKRLKDAARKLGYNMNYAAGIPGRSSFTPPDTGYGLAEASCGFTEATTLSPLQAAAQVRAILMKKPLEIPWSTNLDGFAPKKRLALDVGVFSENAYYGLRQAMIRSVTHGTARKNISTRHMARKNYNALNIGGKTGSLDGSDPKGRYDWFMGFAQSKENPSKAIVLVVLQIYDNQGLRPQPTTQVTGMLINYWAHQNLVGSRK